MGPRPSRPASLTIELDPAVQNRHASCAACPTDLRGRRGIEMEPALKAYTRTSGSTARLAVVVLVLAQLLSVAHFHPLAGRLEYSVSVVAAVDQGLCAACLLHFNSPYAFTAIPPLGMPLWSRRVATLAAQPRLFSAYRSSLFGRAPPASV